MKIFHSSIILTLFIFTFGCNSKSEQKTEQQNEFLEVRINRWTALEGGEIFVLRKINKDWSATLLGDGDRFSCYYQKNVQPKSGYENLWNELQKAGLLEIPDGKIEDARWEDGSGFVVEINFQDKLKRYSFANPKRLKTEESKQILNIGDLINREFVTPVFISDYNRGKVGDYLIENCKDIRK
ncbi:MAG: hypothetical protein ABIP06_00150 [Pyrinomonadaceae bacterium]